MPQEFRAVVRLVASDPGLDAQELEELAQQLRRELLDLGVAGVEREATGPAPEGTRGVDLILAGIGFVVTGLSTAASIAQIAEFVAKWRAAHPRRARVEVSVAQTETSKANRAGRYALLIANADYRDPTLSELRSPVHDVQALAEVLGDPAIGGFEVERLTDAREATVRRRVAAFFSNRDRDDVLLVHFSCHGLKDQRGRLYLAASDTEHHSLAATAIPASFVDDQMSESASRRILLILDCCYSGAFARGARGDRSVHLADDFGGGTGRAILTASSATEYSFEGDQVTALDAQPSVFTGALVAGLRTGEADLDGDGDITADELYEFARRRVREARVGQEPRKWTSDMAGSLVVARSARRSMLPEQIRLDLTSGRDVLRLEAVNALAGLLAGTKPELSEAAETALAAMRDHDDDARVREAAATALKPVIAATAPIKTAPTKQAQPVRTPTRTPTRTPVRLLSAALIVLSLVGGFLYWQYGRSKHQATDNDGRTPITNVPLTGHTGPVTGLTFSPDGSKFVTTAEQDDARLWNVGSASHIARLFAADLVAFSPDGRTLATALVADGAVRTWETATGKQLTNVKLNGYDQGMVNAFSPDLKVLVTTSKKLGEAFMWETATGRRIAGLPGHSAGVWMAFSPDGRTLATGSSLVGSKDYENPIRLWEVATGRLTATLPGNRNGIQGINFSADGKLLATGGLDRQVRIWNIPDGTLKATLAGGTDVLVYDMLLSPDGRLVASRGSTSEPVRVWSVETGKVLATIQGTNVTSFGFSPDGRMLATVTTSKSVALRNAATGALITELGGHSGEITDFGFSPDGKMLVTTSTDKTIRLWSPIPPVTG